jgi:hypothetical protein
VGALVSVGFAFAFTLVFPTVFEVFVEGLADGFLLSRTRARIPPTTSINNKAASKYLELLLARTGCACCRLWGSTSVGAG